MNVFGAPLHLSALHMIELPNMNNYIHLHQAIYAKQSQPF